MKPVGVWVSKGRGSKSRGQSGYAFLLAVFLVASILLFAAAAVPSVLNEGRREREEDAVWRGKQYVRAIRLYYAKNGMLPQTLEDLTKPNAANVHFLRKAYTDPTNRVDGTWRSIYVSPSGQLIGSVRYHNLQELTLAQQGLGVSTFSGTPDGAGASTQQQSGQQPSQQNGQQSGFGPSSGAQSAFGPQSGTQSGFGAPSGLSQTGSGLSASSAQPSSVPLEPVDGPVLGANLIGVAGKTKVPSLLVYEGGKTYLQWEFIYNPLANGAGQLPGAAGAAPAANPAAAPGAAGAQPGATAPTPTPAPAPPPSTDAPGNSTDNPAPQPNPGQ